MSADASQPEERERCELCGGSGWRKVNPQGDLQVVRCDCRRTTHCEYLVSEAGIPARYRDKDLSNFIVEGEQDLLEPALLKARAFVEKYPIEKKGLLITGPSGTGKTHLAIGIIKELIRKNGIACLFFDYSELLNEIRNSYDSQGTREADLLQPVYGADVLVLDDLGTSRSTEWVEEMISLILNNRYKENRTTLITSNYSDGPSADAEPISKSESEDARKARRARRQDTLGDRIGDRMLSRIHEMCRILSIPGSTKDYRSKI